MQFVVKFLSFSFGQEVMFAHFFIIFLASIVNLGDVNSDWSVCQSAFGPYWASLRTSSLLFVTFLLVARRGTTTSLYKVDFNLLYASTSDPLASHHVGVELTAPLSSTHRFRLPTVEIAHIVLLPGIPIRVDPLLDILYLAFTQRLLNVKVDLSIVWL
jgi:hypothetical protein